ncbi:hypothetical protein [Embleya scabrispora]|uniref:hypothetical protein n=1 Tax=Embleya scabrispora TaxID=159449 RepID=UPI00099BC74F|nr:hypothetical protein [Embleya scabrispora]
MSTEHRTFLGLVVKGDITRGKRAEQRPLEELQPLLQAVLDDPTIIEFGWRQYTPYFADGDVCEFGVHGLWFRTDIDDEDASTWDLEVFGHPSLGEEPGTWDETARDYVVGPYEGPDKARYERCRNLASAITDSAFEHVLLAAFGDHAQVTVRKDGIEVETYEHE